MTKKKILKEDGFRYFTEVNGKVKYIPKTKHTKKQLEAMIAKSIEENIKDTDGDLDY